MTPSRTALALPLALACAAETTTGGLPSNAADAVATYARIVAAATEDSARDAASLDEAIDAFLAAPDDAGLSAARTAWLVARESYLQTEVTRFYDGPIDNPETGPEGRINAWPMDESTVDAVEGSPTSGIVNDTTVTITPDELIARNGAGGDENVTTGFHAIEFLLWGQDRSDDAPGTRPHTDFVDGGTAPNADRRRAYLGAVAQLLRDDLDTVRAAWVPGAAYRTELLAADPAEGLRRMLTGMITLSGFETGGERLQAALDSGSQEDEHSCFSDNTHRDMIQDIVGIQNVWLGRYTRSDGTDVTGVGLRDVVAEADSALALALDAKIAASLALANALHIPFDQEIRLDNPDGRARVKALVVSLHEQEDLLEDAFRLFDLAIPVQE